MQKNSEILNNAYKRIIDMIWDDYEFSYYTDLTLTKDHICIGILSEDLYDLLDAHVGGLEKGWNVTRNCIGTYFCSSVIYEDLEKWLKDPMAIPEDIKNGTLRLWAMDNLDFYLKDEIEQGFESMSFKNVINEIWLIEILKKANAKV